MNDRRSTSLKTDAAKLLAESEDLRAFALQRLQQTAERCRELMQFVDANMSPPPRTFGGFMQAVICAA